jgi:hypothetical protein
MKVGKHQLISSCAQKSSLLVHSTSTFPLLVQYLKKKKKTKTKNPSKSAIASAHRFRAEERTTTSPFLVLLSSFVPLLSSTNSTYTGMVLRLLFAMALALLVVSAPVTVRGEPVEVYACDFTDCSKPLAGFDISVIETGDVWTTDSQGMLYLNYSVGQMLSFVIKAQDFYHETQSGTVIVPPGGLTGDQNQVALQVPNDFIYELFKLSTNGHKSDSKCQVVVTVCNKNATVFSFPQGIPGAVVT